MDDDFDSLPCQVESGVYKIAYLHKDNTKGYNIGATIKNPEERIRVHSTYMTSIRKYIFLAR